MKNFEMIWEKAQIAAMTTKTQQFAGCGFAWINIPGRGNFAKYMKEIGAASKNYSGTGLNIWYSKVYSTTSQNIAEHEAACQAAAKVLRDNGIDAFVYSRLD
jgi:hypothetical protein